MLLRVDDPGARRGAPWGWLVIVGLLAACIALDLRPSPDGWIDGRWIGTLGLTQLRPSVGRSITAPIAVPMETTDGFMNRHGGHGVVRFPGSDKAYVFKLFELELEQDVMKPDRPLVRAGRNGYVLKGDGDMDVDPPGLEGLSSSLGSLEGHVAPGVIHLRNCAGYDAAHCGDAYGVTIDLKPEPPASALAKIGHALGTAWRFAVPFVWLLPMFIVFYRKRYQPWSGVWAVSGFTLVAGLTFGITWLIALPMAFGLTTRKPKNRR
ncbi:MAG: hypothetical protein WA840_18460 [Caulobacteraceae bacterium]